MVRFLDLLFSANDFVETSRKRSHDGAVVEREDTPTRGWAVATTPPYQMSEAEWNEWFPPSPPAGPFMPVQRDDVVVISDDERVLVAPTDRP